MLATSVVRRVLANVTVLYCWLIREIIIIITIIIIIIITIIMIIITIIITIIIIMETLLQYFFLCTHNCKSRFCHVITHTAKSREVAQLSARAISARLSLLEYGCQFCQLIPTKHGRQASKST